MVEYDLIGKQVGHLTVIAESAKRDEHGNHYWVCQCDCGKKTVVKTTFLTRGDVTSCGHVSRDFLIEKNKDKEFVKHRTDALLTDKKPSTNTSGYRNISHVMKNGRMMYRVSVGYNHVYHQGFRKTLAEAIDLREELREKYWESYRKNKHKKD